MVITDATLDELKKTREEIDQRIQAIEQQQLAEIVGKAQALGYELLPAAKPRRKRRTKAEIEAARAME